MFLYYVFWLVDDFRTNARKKYRFFEYEKIVVFIVRKILHVWEILPWRLLQGYRRIESL